MSRYTRVEDFRDIMEFPSGYVVRDFYTNIAVDGKIKNLIRSFQRGGYVPFENLETLRTRIDDGRIYVRDKPKKEMSILSQEEIDALLGATDEYPSSTIGPHPLPKKIKFSRNDSSIRIMRQFMREMEDPENSRAFTEGRLDDIIINILEKGENKNG